MNLSLKTGYVMPMTQRHAFHASLMTPSETPHGDTWGFISTFALTPQAD
jgi:hypothetical protein